MKKILSVLLFFTCVPLRAVSVGALENYLFKDPDPGMKTEAFVLQKDGKVYFSRYDHGSPDSRHLLWSMSKSVTSLLFGIAEEKGFINRTDSIYKFYSERVDSLPPQRAKDLKKIKLLNLLQMSSGLDWNELYEEDPFRSHVVKMLYLKATGSMANYVLETPVKAPPGRFFLYSSGDTNVLTGAMKKSLPKNLQDTYPWQWLFDPMGIDAIFEQDGSGSFVGSSYLYLKTKDLLKLGELILNKGLYQGKQLVPKEYIEFATSLSDSMRKRGCLEDSYMTYGAQFWLNHKCPSGERPFPEISDRLVMMLGHGGQSVFIFPKQRIVAVRIAQDKEKALNKQKYSRLILEVFNEK